tara:strand:- start:874 stop:1539 length:666 start_codon:yes stop_codon:yes gene_type:complete
MATFRKLHTTFWVDPFVEDLTQEQKLFYLYLITNTKTKQSGIYEISKRHISYETGFAVKQVIELLAFFEERGKIYYSEETNEIAICNWNKFNYNSSYQSITCIHTDLQEIKNLELIKQMYTGDYIEKLMEDISTKESKHQPKYTPFMDYLCSIHSPSMDNKQQEQEQVEEQVEQQVQLEDQEEAKEVHTILKVEDSPLGGESILNTEDREFKNIIAAGLNK